MGREAEGSAQPQLKPLGKGRDLVGVLDNIRSAWNVGAMVRTADGAGLTHLHLCGISAPPDHPKVAKTSLLDADDLPWTYHRNSLDAAVEIRAQGYELWALETSPESTSLFAPELRDGDQRRIALIVGHERAGVDPELQALADRHVHLPMFGTKSSLNAAVAFGAAIYWLRGLDT